MLDNAASHFLEPAHFPTQAHSPAARANPRSIELSGTSPRLETELLGGISVAKAWRRTQPSEQRAPEALLSRCLSGDYKVDWRQRDLALASTRQEALLGILAAVLPTGRPLLIPDPAPTWLTALLARAQIKTFKTPTGTDGPHLTPLEELLTQLAGTPAAPGALWLMPDFCPPQGGVISDASRRDLVGLADRFGFAVIEDLSWRWSADAALPPTLAARAPHRVIATGGMEPPFGPTLPIAFAAAPGRGDLLRRSIAPFGPPPSRLLTDALLGQLLLGGASLTTRTQSRRHALSVSRTAFEHSLRTLAEARGIPIAFEASAGGCGAAVHIPVALPPAAALVANATYEVLIHPGSLLSDRPECAQQLYLNWADRSPGELEEGIGRLLTFVDDIRRGRCVIPWEALVGVPAVR